MGVRTSPANGVVEEQPLLVTEQDKMCLDWSLDGRFLLYTSQDPHTGSDLWVLPLTGERKPFPLVRTNFDEAQGQLSPLTDDGWRTRRRRHRVRRQSTLCRCIRWPIPDERRGRRGKTVADYRGRELDGGVEEIDDLYRTP